jgi:hypothetical protein
MAPARHTMKIAIDEWQYQKLRETANLSHKRLSSLVREIISEKLAATSELQKTDSIFGIVGMASGDGTAVAESHDDILYGDRA